MEAQWQDIIMTGFRLIILCLLSTQCFVFMRQGMLGYLCLFDSTGFRTYTYILVPINVS